MIVTFMGLVKGVIGKCARGLKVKKEIIDGMYYEGGREGFF